jgi:SAM-dependent methyltransferase
MEEQILLPTKALELFPEYKTNDLNSARKITERVEKIRKKYEQKILWRLRKKELFAISRIDNHPHYKEIIKLINESTRFLDAGDGVGWDLRRVIKDGLRIENAKGIDFDPLLIKIGFELYDDKKIMGNVFEVMDAISTNFEDGYFDIIHSGSVIHGLGYRDKAIKHMQEMYRILRNPNGVFFGRTLGGDSEREIFLRTELYMRYVSTPDKLKEYLAKAGFTEIDINIEELPMKRPNQHSYMLHFFAKT